MVRLSLPTAGPGDNISSCFIWTFLGSNYWGGTWRARAAHLQGGGGTWKRDQHSLFFFRSPAWPPPSLYLPNIVCFSHIYVLSDVFSSQNIVYNISNFCGAYYYWFYTINGVHGVGSAARACPLAVTRHELVIQPVPFSFFSFIIISISHSHWHGITPWPLNRLLSKDSPALYNQYTNYSDSNTTGEPSKIPLGT